MKTLFLFLKELGTFDTVFIHQDLFIYHSIPFTFLFLCTATRSREKMILYYSDKIEEKFNPTFRMKVYGDRFDLYL